jgi:hypothetical protein
MDFPFINALFGQGTDSPAHGTLSHVTAAVGGTVGNPDAQRSNLVDSLESVYNANIGRMQGLACGLEGVDCGNEFGAPSNTPSVATPGHSPMIG